MVGGQGVTAMIKKIVFTFIGLVALLIGFSAIREPITIDPHDPIRNAEAKRRWAEIDRQELISNVKIDKWSWKKGGFDSVMVGTFTLKNVNVFDVKDVVITCQHYAPSGTLLDSNTRTVYQVVKSKASVTIKDFNMGFLHTQASRSSCAVKDFV